MEQDSTKEIFILQFRRSPTATSLTIQDKQATIFNVEVLLLYASSHYWEILENAKIILRFLK